VVVGQREPQGHQRSTEVNRAAGSRTTEVDDAHVRRQGAGNPHHGRQPGRLGEGCLRQVGADGPDERRVIDWRRRGRGGGGATGGGSKRDGRSRSRGRGACRRRRAALVWHRGRAVSARRAGCSVDAEATRGQGWPSWSRQRRQGCREGNNLRRDGGSTRGGCLLSGRARRLRRRGGGKRFGRRRGERCRLSRRSPL
jgi:hypothetical protein